MIFPAPAQGREPAYPENLVRTRDATFLYFQGAKVVAYFHGNGEDLADSVPMVSLLRSLGMGVLAVEYPGYGIAGGTPSEQGAYAAAQSALDWLRAESGVDAGRVVLLGQSLGSGVATEMAKRGLGARMVLVSPFTSVADMARRLVPFFPASSGASWSRRRARGSSRSPSTWNAAVSACSTSRPPGPRRTTRPGSNARRTWSSACSAARMPSGSSSRQKARRSARGWGFRRRRSPRMAAASPYS